jgi:hypothetical protein
MAVLEAGRIETRRKHIGSSEVAALFGLRGAREED